MDTNHTKEKLFVALDGLELKEAQEIVRATHPFVYGYKVHDLLDKLGLGVISRLKAVGKDAIIWADYKLHDVPATVKNRAKALSEGGSDIITVHASGGIPMMQAATEFDAQIFGITVLTSLSEEEAFLTFGKPSKAAALQLAINAKLAGLGGIVCSSKELPVLTEEPLLKEMEFIVPGIRLANGTADDQKRVGTPFDAINSGATKLVVGRPITKNPMPLKIIEAINQQITEALGGKKEAK